MDLTSGSVDRTFFRYLRSSFAGTMIVSIYSLVDAAMVGKYAGPPGAAALAVVIPIFTIFFATGMLIGIGGAVHFSALRGAGGQDARRRSNEFFTSALITTIAVGVVLWAIVLVFDEELLRFFGATDDLLPIAMRYTLPIKIMAPTYLFSNVLNPFAAADGDPERGTKAVIAGGVFNIFGDWLFVFELDWGVFGAGFATGIGGIITTAIIITHFFSKRNGISLVRPSAFAAEMRAIVSSGFSAFFVDVAGGALIILFCRRTIDLFDGDALAVYGALVNVAIFVQSCGYSVGHAVQPIAAANFGAGLDDRVCRSRRCAIIAASAMSAVFVAATIALPGAVVSFFMEETPRVAEIAPPIVRAYAPAFAFVPFNITATFFLRATMRPGTALAIAILRGPAIAGACVFVMPMIFGPFALWAVMPVAEAITAIYSWRAIFSTRAQKV